MIVNLLAIIQSCIWKHKNVTTRQLHNKKLFPKTLLDNHPLKTLGVNPYSLYPYSYLSINEVQTACQEQRIKNIPTFSPSSSRNSIGFYLDDWNDRSTRKVGIELRVYSLYGVLQTMLPSTAKSLNRDMYVFSAYHHANDNTHLPTLNEILLNRISNMFKEQNIIIQPFMKKNKWSWSIHPIETKCYRVQRGHPLSDALQVPHTDLVNRVGSYIIRFVLSHVSLSPSEQQWSHHDQKGDLITYVHELLYLEPNMVDLIKAHECRLPIE